MPGRVLIELWLLVYSLNNIEQLCITEFMLLLKMLFMLLYMLLFMLLFMQLFIQLLMQLFLPLFVLSLVLLLIYYQYQFSYSDLISFPSIFLVTFISFSSNLYHYLFIHIHCSISSFLFSLPDRIVIAVIIVRSPSPLASADGPGDGWQWADRIRALPVAERTQRGRRMSCGAPLFPDAYFGQIPIHFMVISS